VRPLKCDWRRTLHRRVRFVDIVNGGNFGTLELAWKPAAVCVTASSNIEWLRFLCDSGLFKFAARSGTQRPVAGTSHGNRKSSLGGRREGKPGSRLRR
jgi:hypothetical protein